MNVFGSTHYETPASELVLLSELANIEVGTKVRFRGCVSSYSHQTGTLYLTLTHPSPPTTAVDIALVRESVKGPAIITGAYVNVIGNLTSTMPTSSRATYSNVQDHLPGTPPIPATPGSLFSPSASYFGSREPSFTAASAVHESMQDLERAGWNTTAFDCGKGTAQASTDTLNSTHSHRKSKSFSTRTPSTYLLQKQRSDISLKTANARTNSSGIEPQSHSPVSAPVRAHGRTAFHTYTPSALNFASLAEQNQYERASIASHATGASVATTRRGAVGARNAMQDEEEYVVARVQAVVLFSAEAVGEKNKKMGPSFEDSVKARRWGMCLMKAAREKYNAGVAQDKSAVDGAGPPGQEGGWRKSFE